MNKKKESSGIFTLIRYYLLVISALLLAEGCSESPPAPIKQKTEATKEIKEVETSVLKPFDDETALSFFSKKDVSAQLTNFRIETEFGNIELVLFEDTPLHLANFNHLVNENYFNGTWFYRVSENHVIQAGNTDGQETIRKRKKIGEYLLPAEKLNAHLHTYGAIAAARPYRQNAEKRSDPFEFYIVIGKKYSAAQLEQMVSVYGFDLTQSKIEAYSKLGGAPHLDGEHTVFGRVTKGMDVVEKIAAQETDEGEWPLLNIPIKVSPIKN